MIAKKTEKANLENKRFLFFEIGMALALAAILLIIESAGKNPRNSIIACATGQTPDIEMIMEVTRPEMKKEMKPPEIPQIEIVETNTEIEEESFTFNVDMNWDGIIEHLPLKPPEEKADDLDFIWFAEKMPRYQKGGLEKFHKFIQQIVEYPLAAVEVGLSGRVFVKFIINKEGYITGIEIQQGIHPLLDNAVISAIRKSERWEPGMQGGRPVNVAMSMPVIFRLQ